MSVANSTKDSGGGSPDHAKLVQAIGQALNMGMLYGVDHKVTRASLESSYPVVVAFLDAYDHLDLNIDETGLLINGSPVDAPLAGTVSARLSAHKLFSFEICKGISLEEYGSLFTILLTPPAKLNGAAIGKLGVEGGIPHIQPRSVEYRRVAGDAVPAEVGTAPGQPAKADAASPDLENILAFLKNDDTANPARSAEDIRRLAGDAEKLAELILRTVEIRAVAGSLATGESLTDIVVGAIGKVISELTEGDRVRTEKGRKHAKRSIMILEKALLQTLRQIAGKESAEAAKAMLDDAADGLDMETMAAKYMKSRRAVDEADEKLRRVIAGAADPDQVSVLHDTLVAHGMTEDGWQNLMVSRGTVMPSEPGPEGASGLGDIKTLTLLLARLGETITPGTTPSGEGALRELTAETKRLVDRQTDGAAKKILALRQALGKDGSSEPIKLTRLQLLELLAEIGQELSQPLTVVTTTIDMLKTGRPGGLTEIQAELLAMAADSNARLAHLVDCLIKIAGHPESAHPDQAILSALYDPHD